MPMQHSQNSASEVDASSQSGSWSIRLTEPEAAWLDRRLVDLTPRERDVVRELCVGGANEAVAERLFIALPTLRTHLMRINQKLGTRGKGDVVRLVVGNLLHSYRRGLIEAASGEDLGKAGASGAPGVGRKAGPSGLRLTGSGQVEAKGVGGPGSARDPEKSSFPMTTDRSSSTQ